ncbi:MAG: C10 family peptidase, partial [Planctomycetota bacterium]
HPTAGVGTPSYTIYVDGSPQTASLRGGDGAGGPYVWDQMMLLPDHTITETQRQAIGALCYDAGVATETRYRSTDSSTVAYKISDALIGPFGYGNAVYGDIRSGYDLDRFLEMVNPNLDADLPAILTIMGKATTGIYHEIVCDGYGYDSATLYHHLNMGWGGADNAWYALPDVGTSYEFNTIVDCSYNVFPSGTGEAISGRVTDGGATVIAHAYGGQTYFTATNEKGIYAFAGIPSDTIFHVQAVGSGWRSDACEVRTGTSVDWSWAPGNVWGLNFRSTSSTGFVDLERQAYITPEVVTVRVVDTDLQGNGTHVLTLETCEGDTESVTLTESPADSGIFAADVATAEGAVVTGDGIIQASGAQTLIAVYEDANDGAGDPITRRDIATVATGETTIYETDFTGGLPPAWTIINGYLDDNTWTSENPGNRLCPFWSGTFMIVDCLHPIAIGFDEQLITYGMDCSMYDRVTLLYGHLYRHNNVEICSVDVRAGGGEWYNVARYQGADAWGNEQIDITAPAAGQADVQIRWHYYGNTAGEYWGIDNVELRGVIPASRPPGDFEPDCDVDWVDLGVLAAEWLQSGPRADIAPLGVGDGIVNLRDFALLAADWSEAGP